MSATRITIIDGHPDPNGTRYVHALADAYAAGGEAAGHEVRRIEIAELDFPILRSPGSGGQCARRRHSQGPDRAFAGRIMWSSFTHYGSETFLCSEVIQCIYCVADASGMGKLLGTGEVS